MAEGIEFQLKLQDQMTASLRSSAESALKLDQALQKLTGRLESVEKGERSEKQAEEGMFTSAVAKGEILKDIIEHVAEAVYDLGRELVRSTIEVTDFGYRAEVALRHLNGETEESQGRTTKMLAEAKQFALDAGLPLQSVTESFLELRRAGLSDEWARPLTAAAGDLAALGGHPEQFKEIVDVFAHVGAAGGLDRAVRVLSTNGVQAEVLGRHLGLAVHSSHELMEQLSRHPIGANQALRAIEETIKETAHEKTLGDVLKEDASTFGAQITRVKDVWEILLDNLNSDPIFKNLRTDFGSLVDDLIANLPNIENQLTTTFDPIIKAIDDLVKNPTALKNFFDEASEAIRGVSTLVSLIVKGLTFIGEHPNIAEAAPAAAVGYRVGGLPGAIIAGGAAATFGGASQAEKDFAANNGAPAFPGGPNLVGHFADGGPVPDTGLALVHEGEFVVPPGGARVSGGGGSGGGKIVNAPIHVEVHVAGHGDAQELKLMLEEIMPGLLVSPLEKLAATTGAM